MLPLGHAALLRTLQGIHLQNTVPPDRRLGSQGHPATRLPPPATNAPTLSPVKALSCVAPDEHALFANMMAPFLAQGGQNCLPARPQGMQTNAVILHILQN